MAASRREPLVVAVDIGSSSVRAGVFDVAGRLRRGRFAQLPYDMTVDPAGGVVIEPARLLEVVRRTLDALVARAPDDLERIIGAGISCFLHSVAGLDRRGNALTPLLTWADTTGAAQAAALRGVMSEHELWQRTGSPLHASYWPAKILRLRQVPPRRIERWAGAGEIVFEALTGRCVMDVSMASGTGLLNRSDGSWDMPLLREVGVDRAALPELASRGDAMRLRGWAAERWPSLARVPWLPPWSDALCGNVGLGCVAGGPAALMIGTSGAMRAIIHGPVSVLPAGLFAHRLGDGTSLVGGQLSEGGAVIAAVARLLGRSPRGLAGRAASREPDGHGLTVLPYLAGERGPGYHAEARGAIVGLTLHTDRADVLRAFLEAIAYRFAAIDARLATVLERRPRVVASGGALVRSALWLEIMAAALGRDIEAASTGEASSRGAAILALASLGAISGPEAVPPPRTRLVRVDANAADRYRAAAARQDALYSLLLAPPGR
jgi:gluconokinase